MTSCGGPVTVTCGVQGPQGAPGVVVAAVVPVTVSALLTAAQNSTLFTNTGATSEVDLTLPVALVPFQPLIFSLLVAAAQTFSFIAPSGVTIINGSDSSSTGGSISSNVIGNFLTIVMVSATEWVVTDITGIWTLT